jgi:hypothetical protein
MRVRQWPTELGSIQDNSSRKPLRHSTPRRSNTTSSGAGFRALSKILWFLNQPLRVSLLWVAAAASFIGFFGCVALVALFMMWFDFGSATVFSVGACSFAFCVYVIVCRWLPRG